MKQCRQSPSPLAGLVLPLHALEEPAVAIQSEALRHPGARPIGPDEEPAGHAGSRAGARERQRDRACRRRHALEGSAEPDFGPRAAGLIDDVAEKPRRIRRHEEVGVALQFDEAVPRIVDPDAPDPADERRRSGPLLPRFLDEDPGGVDALPRLRLPLQDEHGEPALRRPPRAGKPREPGPHHDEIVVRRLTRRPDDRQRPARPLSRRSRGNAAVASCRPVANRASRAACTDRTWGP